MERRRRRRRRRKHGSSDTPKPLSIDILRKKRYKNAKSKRVAAVRLDLDDSRGFNNSGFNRKQLFWKILTLILVLMAISAVIYDYGFDKLKTQISDFTSSIGKGTEQTVSEMSTRQQNGTTGALSQVAQLQGEVPPVETKAPLTFYPDGNSEAISRIQLALNTAKIGLISEAMLLIDEAKAIDPELTGTDYIRGAIYFDAGKHTEARSFLHAAKEYKKTRFLAHLSLGKLELNEKEYQAAAEHFAIARKLKPQDSAIAVLLSTALRMNLQHQEGLFEAQAAHKLSPEQPLFKIAASLAAIQADSFEPSQKLLDLINAEDINTSASPYDLVIAAGWEQRRGNRDKVKKYWKIVRPHSTTMTSLKKLEKDPLFLISHSDLNTAELTSLPTPPETTKPKEQGVAPIQSTAEFSENIPTPEFDLDLSMEAKKTLESGFLQLGNEPIDNN